MAESDQEVVSRYLRGEAEAVPWLKRFYFGDPVDQLEGLKELVTDLGDIDAREVNSFPVGNDISDIGSML